MKYKHDKHHNCVSYLCIIIPELIVYEVVYTKDKIIIEYLIPAAHAALLVLHDGLRLYYSIAIVRDY